ncbi:universal stress protein [Halorubrum sp. DTA98]|uniref:universal stress protein n=1 Tax=Halorubrum sp. DTA98 TaxID=3402163 RepID=UPI003AAF491E
MSVEIDPSDHEPSLHGSTTTRGSRSDETNEVDTEVSADVDVTGLFERVLVVTNGEDPGDAAITAGVDLAAAHGATVDALYVVDTTEHWDMAVERRERTGEAAVEAAAAHGDRLGVDVEKWFRYGTAHEEVLGFAEAHDVDVIVVGSARRTGLDRLVNPETIPVRVQRGADCPVLVVGVDGE